MANFFYLQIGGAPTLPVAAADLEVDAYSIGASNTGSLTKEGSKPTLAPFQVSIIEGSSRSTLIGDLMADAATGAVLPEVTFFETTATGSGAVFVQQITLTNATVVDAQSADFQSAFAFDYGSMTIQLYTGGQMSGAPVTYTASGPAQFAAPSSVALSNLGSTSHIALNVSGDPGPSTNYAGDFEAVDYSFSVVNPTGVGRGRSTPLVVDLSGSGSDTGVPTLLADALSGKVIPTVTLDLILQQSGTTVALPIYEEIVLTDATVENYSGAIGDVQVSFDYGSAKITTYPINANGTLGAGETVAIGGTSAASAPCYGAGTRILTERGEVAVEALVVGDRVVTASRALRPIVWIGHRQVDIARHPDPRKVQPVRVSAHAFGEGLPHRDLWLSPGHNIASQDMLMPISALVNGQSVKQIERDSVEYWHVELDAHDVIFAEGLPAESYLDTGNRAAFVNGGAFVEAHPDFAPRHWADGCLPTVLDGPQVVAARACLLARLAETGCGIDNRADAHVRFDGVRVEPIHLDGTRLVFELPSGGHEIELRSRTFIPAHSLAESDDQRQLGLCVGALQIDGAAVGLALDDDCGVGWERAEFEGERFSHRWTSGASRLPAGARIVIVDLVGEGRYWRRSEAGVAALSA